MVLNTSSHQPKHDFFISSMHAAQDTFKTHGQRSPGEKPGLTSLPYDLLLNVASYLECDDIHNLHLVRSLVDIGSPELIMSRTGL